MISFRKLITESSLPLGWKETTTNHWTHKDAGFSIWIEDNDDMQEGTYLIVGQVEGYPSTQVGEDVWYAREKDARKDALKLITVDYPKGNAK